MDNPQFVLICYRPNGFNTCRGHVTDQSDSDFEYVATHEIEEVVRVWSEKLYMDETRREYSGTCKWEISLLINGFAESYWHDNPGVDQEYINLFSNITDRANGAFRARLKQAEDKQREDEEKKAREALIAKEVARQKSETRDRAEYNRLKAKYE